MVMAETDGVGSKLFDHGDTFLITVERSSGLSRFNSCRMTQPMKESWREGATVNKMEVGQSCFLHNG